MATAVTEAAAAQVRRNFVRGHKKLYLPEHVITFIRPKPRQSPNLATFVVPLQFNKLDLRDYLWHAYNVKVLAVRSFINEKPVERRGGAYGKVYRPRSEKMMIVELEKPFVWPKPLEGEALEDFDHYMWRNVQDAQDERIKEQEDRGKGILPLPSEQPVSPDRMTLTQQVNALLEGKEVWKNDAKLDERWEQLEKRDQEGQK